MYTVQVLNTATFYSASKGSLSGFVPPKEIAFTVLLGDNNRIGYCFFPHNLLFRGPKLGRMERRVATHISALLVFYFASFLIKPLD